MCGSRRYTYSPDRIGYNFLSDVMGVWGGGGGLCIYFVFKSLQIQNKHGPSAI